MTVREAKFGPNPHHIGVEGGDIVVVIDGWANFQQQVPKHVDTVMSACCGPATTGCVSCSPTPATSPESGRPSGPRGLRTWNCG
jgi:hypothetical protein